MNLDVMHSESWCRCNLPCLAASPLQQALGCFQRRAATTLLDVRHSGDRHDRRDDLASQIDTESVLPTENFLWESDEEEDMQGAVFLPNERF